MTDTTLQGEFNPPVQSRVVFGQGKVVDLKAEVENLGGRRVLLLSGKTVAEKTDAVKKVASALGDRCVATYSGLTQRAPLATAVQAARMAGDLEVDTLVGVGGSTISDAARMIAVMMAEGISSEEQLRELGCDYAQGYFYSKPIPVTDAIEFYAQGVDNRTL